MIDDTIRSEALELNKNNKDIIGMFNEEMIKELKSQECYNCGRQIIGKGYLIHDSFGEITYCVCDKKCGDEFMDKVL